MSPSEGTFSLFCGKCEVPPWYSSRMMEKLKMEHKRMHLYSLSAQSGIPYVCGYCGIFTSTVYRVIYNGKELYMCSECSQKLHKSSPLDLPVQIEEASSTDNNKFTCLRCGAESTTRTYTDKQVLCDACYVKSDSDLLRIQAGTHNDLQSRKQQQAKDEPALKFDGNKCPVDLLPTESLEEIAWVLHHGAEKYGAHNWREGMSWTRLGGAALRHIFAWLRGEDTDPESGRPHLAHAGCCIVFLLSYAKMNGGKDDRWKHTACSSR